MQNAAATHRLADFAAEFFQPRLGDTFRFLRPQDPAAGRETADLTLIEVHVSRHPGVPGKRQPFSLLFTLRDAPPLNDRLTHTLSHPGLEPCEILLSRVTVPSLEKHDGTMYYEAVFG
jgi:hypothetical protein